MSKPKKVHVVEIVKHGKQFIIPAGISYEQAMELLERQKKYEEEPCEISETVDAFIWDGALAMHKAMEQQFGWATAEVIPGLFGSTPPRLIAVDISVTETVMVPWGEFSLPGIEGRMRTKAGIKDGHIVFKIEASVRRKNEGVVRELIALTRKIVKEQSIYRGKAFKMRFRDENGEQLDLPEPKFLDLRQVNENQLIFSDDVMRAVSTSLFTPVEKVEQCRQYKIPLKRGILLSGPYGTGKTLAAYVTAKKCERFGWTFLYCERADELAEMVRFAHHYQPAVIFCEDIDRVMEGDRNVKMDEILNIIDGIESKSTEIMVILTTNHLEKINQAILRPGRLDAVINVLPPDAAAVEKLLRLYGGDLIPENADLSEASRQLANQIPAVIRECIERAKLSALKMSQGALLLTAEAIMDAAMGMQNHLDLLRPPKNMNLQAKMERAIGKAMTSDLDLDEAMAKTNGGEE